MTNKYKQTDSILKYPLKMVKKFFPKLSFFYIKLEN